LISVHITTEADGHLRLIVDLPSSIRRLRINVTSRQGR
jgi:hypothetical protein